MDLRITSEGDISIKGQDIETVEADAERLQTAYWILRTTNPDFADDTALSPDILKRAIGVPNTAHALGPSLARSIKDKLVRAGIGLPQNIKVKTGPLSLSSVGILITIGTTQQPLSLVMSLESGKMKRVSSLSFDDPVTDNPILKRNLLQ